MLALTAALSSPVNSIFISAGGSRDAGAAVNLSKILIVFEPGSPEHYPWKPFLNALIWPRKLFMPKSDSSSKRPSSS
jgi:hypothetical protein